MKIAIIGAGGHAKVVADVARSAGYEIECFVSDDKKEHCGVPVITFDTFVAGSLGYAAVAIGNNIDRARVYKLLKQNNIECPTIIHESAVISKSATIGEATVIMPGVVVNAYATIGVGCILNSGAIIEHDCTIGDFAHISPNAALAGGANIGEMTHIGIGVSVIQLIKIGKECIIGAGAAVISDIPDAATAVGVPARIIKDSN